ncbi:MAG: thioredoxin domain-containing protein [Thermodesulfobacteriota bacterium]|nr:thioredoxin domain-containing protein [Thermodesulfobacteriota bacterium]
MLKKTFLQVACLIFLSFSLATQGFAQKDNIAQIAIDTVRSHVGLPPGVEIKFIEKKESPVPGFYSVKMVLATPDKEIPIVIYVDKAGERVFLGTLVVKGENVTRKEAGEPKPRKVDPALLEMERSPFRGPAQAKVTIVEFSNFHCSYCLKSWKQMEGLLQKYPQDIKYVFKHFPLQSNGKAWELSEMVAAVQMVSNEAFWVIHDFFFSDEGQAIINNDREQLRLRIEIILKQKGFDMKPFQAALTAMYGKARVEEDVAIGAKIGVNATPSTVINGNFVRGSLPEKTIERHLGR